MTWHPVFSEICPHFLGSDIFLWSKCYQFIPWQLLLFVTKKLGTLSSPVTADPPAPLPFWSQGSVLPPVIVFTTVCSVFRHKIICTIQIVIFESLAAREKFGVSLKAWNRERCEQIGRKSWFCVEFLRFGWVREVELFWNCWVNQKQIVLYQFNGVWTVHRVSMCR